MCHLQSQRPSNPADSLLVYCFLSYVPSCSEASLMLRSLSEVEGNSMDLKDLIFHSHSKNKVCSKKAASQQSWRIASWKKRQAHFWKNQGTPHSCSSTCFFFMCHPLQTQTQSFHVHIRSSYRDTSALGFMLLNQKSYSLQIHMEDPDQIQGLYTTEKKRRL